MRYALVALQLIAACSGSREHAPPQPAPPPAALRIVAAKTDTVRAAAHEVLARRCGECHERHRPTANPKALQIFDLDAPDWPARFDEHRFGAALMRLKAPPAEDAAKFVAFRDAELAARR